MRQEVPAGIWLALAHRALRKGPPITGPQEGWGCSDFQIATNPWSTVGDLGQDHSLGFHHHSHLLDVCLTGPVGEEPQMPGKDAKAMMGAEDTPGGKASPNPQDLRRSMFYSIKVSLRACWE